MSNELQEKIAKLPSWVREHIKQLERQPASDKEEVRILRQRVSHLEGQNRRIMDRLEACHSIMEHAAKGGHETAQAYVDRIISEYKSEPEEDDNG